MRVIWLLDNYTVYHLHSDFSNCTTNIDSVTKFTDYVERARGLGMGALGFSEHGNIYGWWRKKCAVEAAGMKYIHAVEAYLTETLEEKVRDNYHCVLIARNYQGFLELNRLVTRSHNRLDNHFYYVPRISFNELFATTDNIIITTACVGGPLCKGSEDVQDKLLCFLTQEKHRCFLEIGHHPDPRQAEYNRKLLALHDAHGIPLIAGTDTHALDEEHLAGRKIMQLAKRIHFDGEDTWDLQFRSFDDLREAYQLQDALPEAVWGTALANTNVLADIAVAAKSVDAAKNFETSMADVAKVVDGLKDESGKTTQAYADMSDEILALTTRIPMSAEEIAQIIAAAGQSGIDSSELTRFAEGAAKMGTAFDVSADQAGQWMAQWRTSLSLTQDEVVSLADQINYLGNTSSEDAAKLSTVVSNVGSLGKIAGLSAGEVAALGAATTGIEASKAATGLKGMFVAMTAGSAATSRQVDVLDKLGFSATGLAKRMQTDAQGAIMDFLGAVNKLPKAEQAAALSQYFGKGSLDTVSKLAGNLDNLKDQFDKVGDASRYAGSMEGEFAAASATAANAQQLLKNVGQMFLIKVGNMLLPILKDISANLLPVLLDVIGSLLPVIQSVIDSIDFKMLGDLAAEIFPILADAIKQVLTAIGPMLPTLIKVGVILVQTLLPPLADLITQLLPVLLPLLDPILQIITSLLPLVESLVPVIVLLAKFISGKLLEALNVVQPIISAVATLFSGLFDVIVGLFNGDHALVINGLKKLLSGIVNTITGIINGLIQKVNGMIAKIPGLGKFQIPEIPEMTWGSEGGGSAVNAAGRGGKFGEATKAASSAAKVPAAASGAVVTRPTLLLAGEGGESEAVLPLSRLNQMLGNTYNSSNRSESVVFAPNINGNANPAEMRQTMQEEFERFKLFYRRLKAQERRTKFQPV